MWLKVKRNVLYSCLSISSSVLFSIVSKSQGSNKLFTLNKNSPLPWYVARLFSNNTLRFAENIILYFLPLICVIVKFAWGIGL